MGANVVMVYLSDSENAQKVEEGLNDYVNQKILLKADITKAKDRNNIIRATLW